MGLELAKAYILIRADSRHLSADMAAVRNNLVSELKTAAQVAGMIPTALDYILSKAVAVGEATVTAAIESMQVERRLQAALEATGEAAGYSKEELLKYANELQSATTFDDEAIIGVMTRLTMFRKVTGETFKQATAAALDLAARGLGTAETNAHKLGLALENPARNMMMLRRTGISFTDTEKEKIKRLQETNQLFEAQAFILSKLNAVSKGAAASLAQGMDGQYKQLGVSIQNVQESIGGEGGLLPLMIRLREQTLANSYIMLGFSKIIGTTANYTGQWIPNILLLTKAVKWLGITFAATAMAAKIMEVQITASLVKLTLGLSLVIGALITAVAAIAAVVQKGIKSIISIKEVSDALNESWGRLSETFSAFGDIFKTTLMDISEFGKGLAWVIRQLTDLIVTSARGIYFLMMMGKIASETGIKVTTAMATLNPQAVLKAYTDAAAATDAALTKAMTLGDLEKGSKGKAKLPIPDEITLKIDSGRFGFRELGRHIQDAMLKGNRDTGAEQVAIGKEMLKKQDTMIRELVEMNAADAGGMLE